jgi:accessory gene regulator B
MVEKMVLSLVNQMREEDLISETDREFYEYALVTMAERIIVIASLLIISLCVRQIIPSICFMVFFFSLRKRTGGYHADKFWQCYLLTVITFIAITQIATTLANNFVIMYILLGLSVIVIEIIGTVNHPNMDMDSLELKASKRAARILAMAELAVIVVMALFNVNMIYQAYTSIAVILCASLLCLAKVIKQEVQEDEKS